MTTDLTQKGSSLLEVDPFFVPYGCHIDPHTILTKNGNLLQTFKITGFNFEIVGKEQVSLRRTLRTSLREHLPNASFAVWIHTIRRKKNLSLEATYENDFCKSLDDAWHSLHDWSQKFVNELYITILTESKSYKPSKLSNIVKILNFSILKKVELNFIKNNLKKLNNVTDKILNDLQDFGAHKLTLVKHDGIYYSEILRFLGKIINLEESDVKVQEKDLSVTLPYCRIAFGKNALEVIDENRKHYAAIFSIKEYSELSLSSLDKFLQLPVEFIVTQTLDFINSDEAIKEFKYQHQILQISKDIKFEEISGIQEIMDADHHKETDYGEQQLTLMILADTQGELDKSIKKTVKIFCNYGLSIVREDIFMENCYWSQLPGNFSYITRRKPINTERIGGFASLTNFPAGKLTNNKWGDSVTVFYTQNQTPYFFNFHYGNNGHTLVIGPYGTGKTVLLNFLLTQATKFNYKLFYIDFFNSSKIFVKALGGKYFDLDFNSVSTFFNPCLTFNQDSVFFKNFLSYLMLQKDELQDGKYVSNPKKEEIINTICDKIENNTIKLNKLSDLAAFFENTEFADLFKLWVNDGKLAHFFDNKDDIFLDNQNYLGIDVTKISDYKAILIPVIFYVMHKIEKILDGSPTILVVDEAFKLLDNPFLGQNLHDWLARLKEKNCVVIIASESIEDVKNSHIKDLLIDEISTQFYLPSSDVGKEYKEIFKLTAEESDMINTISNDSRHFLLKHGNDSIIAELDLSSLDHIISILSSNETSIDVMEKIIQRFGKDPEQWIPEFQTVITQLLDSEDSSQTQDTEDDIIEDYENIASQEKQAQLSSEVKTASQ